jgi:hypothetical protein
LDYASYPYRTDTYSANYGTGKTSFYSVNSTFGGFSNLKVAEFSWDSSSYDII